MKSRETIKIPIESTDAHDHTALSEAAKGHTDVVEYLADKGADPNAQMIERYPCIEQRFTDTKK